MALQPAFLLHKNYTVQIYLEQKNCTFCDEVRSNQESHAVAGKPRDAAVIFHPGFDGTGNSAAIWSANPEKPTLELELSGSDHLLRRYGHSNIPRWWPVAIFSFIEHEK